MDIGSSTKAEALAELEGVVRGASILPQFRFTVGDWQIDRLRVLTNFREVAWQADAVIVRSSGIDEDGDQWSKAGQYESVADVNGESELIAAIDKVVTSYPDNSSLNQIFVQPMLHGIKASGVAFSRDPSTGGHYYILNYESGTGVSDSVTSGKSNELATIYVCKGTIGSINGVVAKAVALLEELESLLQSDSLDIEFAVSNADELFLLQVRPLALRAENVLTVDRQLSVIKQIDDKIHKLNIQHPYLHGDRTVFGVMPDWNPAEIYRGQAEEPGTFSLSRTGN